MPVSENLSAPGSMKLIHKKGGIRLCPTDKIRTSFEQKQPQITLQTVQK